MVNKMVSKAKFFAREILALLFWIYLITKLFVFDLDIYLLKNFLPEYAFILDYKYFAFLPAISFYWVWVGNSQFFRNIGYISFYPFINILWKIPKSLFQRRSWFLIFTYFNFAFSFLKSLKINLFILSIFSLSALLVLQSSNNYLIIFGATVLGFLLLYHLYQKLYFAFNPSTAFAVDARSLQNSLDNDSSIEYFLSDNNKDDNEGQERNKHEDNDSDSLEKLVLYGGIIKFIASRLKNFQKTKVYILFFVLGLVFTLLFSSVVITFANYSLYKIDPASFNLYESPSFLLFFYYSFNTIFANQIYEIIPAATSTRILYMGGIFIGILVLAILVSIYFSTKTERYQEELKEMIRAVDLQGNVVESYILEEYSLSFEQALEELKNIESAMYRFLYHLSKGIDKET